MPRLTVVMPAKNAEKTIRGALKSTLHAMPRDAELVVWDDGSTDLTGQVAGDVADSRLRVIRSDVSVGGGLARARVLAATDSQIVSSMDADDVCMPWRYHQQLKLISKYDFVFGSTVRFRTAPLRMRFASTIALSPLESNLALLVSNPFPHPTMTARRSWVDSVGGYRDLRVAQDYDLWLRAAAAGARLFKSRCPVVGYRESDSQVSNSADYITRVRGNSELLSSYLDLLRRESPASYDVLKSDLLESSQVTEFDATLLQSTQLLRPSTRHRLQQAIRDHGTFLTFQGAVAPTGNAS